MGLVDLLDRAFSTDSDEEDITDTPDTGAGVQVPDDASELDDVLPPDPKPKKPARTRTPRTAAAKVTAAQKRQVEDALVLLMKILGGGISFRDQVCGPALVDSSADIAKAAAPLIARNPVWLAWFTGGTGFLDLLALATALQPVAAAIWGHHVTHRLGHDDGDGGGPVDYSGYNAPSL